LDNCVAVEQSEYILHSTEICLIGVKGAENRSLEFIQKVSEFFKSQKEHREQEY
jgi:hypothetical protein